MLAFVDHWYTRTGFGVGRILRWLGWSSSKYHHWKARRGQPAAPPAPLPKSSWLLAREKQAIIEYHRLHPEEGYRRLTFMMLDEEIVAVSPSSVYRVLRAGGWLAGASKAPSRKGQGFEQPLAPHQHWQVDITYINICGTFYYLCALLDGYSR